MTVEMPRRIWLRCENGCSAPPLTSCSTGRRRFRPAGPISDAASPEDGRGSASRWTESMAESAPIRSRTAQSHRRGRALWTSRDGFPDRFISAGRHEPSNGTFFRRHHDVARSMVRSGEALVSLLGLLDRNQLELVNQWRVGRNQSRTPGATVCEMRGHEDLPFTPDLHC